jgi:hypothetical protein
MAPLPLPAYGFGAAAEGGRVYAMGGYVNPSGTIVVDSATVYVGALDAFGAVTGWSLGTRLPVTRAFGWCAADRGKLYFGSGILSGTFLTGSVIESDLQANGTNGAWVPVTTHPVPAYGPGGTVARGVLYVTGGWVATNTVTTDVRHAAVNDNLVPSPGASYTDTAVTNGVTYYYRVRTLDTQGHLSDTSPETYATPGGPMILELTLVSSTSYGFGLVTAGQVAVSVTTFDILNSGNVPVTLSLSVTNTAGGWAPVTTGAPGQDQFELDAQFNAPSAPASWSPANHALRPSPPGPDTSSTTRFAGNELGLGVAMGQARHLWVRLLAPSTTSQPGRQRMVITVAAQSP